MTKETIETCYRALVRLLTDLEEQGSKADPKQTAAVQKALEEIEKER